MEFHKVACLEVLDSLIYGQILNNLRFWDIGDLQWQYLPWFLEGIGFKSLCLYLSAICIITFPFPFPLHCIYFVWMVGSLRARGVALEGGCSYTLLGLLLNNLSFWNNWSSD